jgi:hypothetical protein
LVSLVTFFLSGLSFAHCADPAAYRHQYLHGPFHRPLFPSDDFDSGSSSGDSEEDLGPEDGEEQEDEEADFVDYGVL